MAARKAAPAEVAPVVHASLNEALLAVQAAMPAFQRDSVNPHFNSSYLALESLMPQVLAVLNAHGLLLMQTGSFIAGAITTPALRSRITHVATGEMVEDWLPLSAGAESPQKQGSALTYARRYALMSMLGIVADKDDDGNLGSRPVVGAADPLAGNAQVITMPTGTSADSAGPVFGGAL